MRMSLIALFIGACSGPGPAGEARQVGLALTPNEATTVAQAWSAARQIGISEPGDINVSWGDYEPEAGRFVDDGAISALADLPGAARLAVTLAPIQTTAVSVPPDLSGRVWDDPALVERYVAAAQDLVQRVGPDRVHTFSVGNEVDVVLADDPEAWAAWAVLLDATRTALHQEHPDIRVGVKLTAPAWQGSEARDLLEFSDVAIVSWYPLGDGFQVMDRDATLDALDRAMDATAPVPVYVAEVGLPSGAACGSSETRQADFVDDVFGWWDDHPERVDTVTFVWSHDLPPATVDALVALYGIDDPGFRAYLASLGLHDADGGPKPGWTALAAQIEAREP